jgi:hypothetical protein
MKALRRLLCLKEISKHGSLQPARKIKLLILEEEINTMNCWRKTIIMLKLF